jgi:hypothetical protein
MNVRKLKHRQSNKKNTLKKIRLQKTNNKVNNSLKLKVKKMNKTGKLLNKRRKKGNYKKTLKQKGGKNRPGINENKIELPLNTTHHNSIISFKDKSFDDNLFVRESHNCYTYFLNLKSKSALELCKKDFNKHNMCRRAQPGYLSGHPTLTKSDYKCPVIMKRTLDDNPNIYKLNSIKDTCDPRFYKGALVVAPGRDYHYYRLDDDNNGFWSHKPGYKPSTMRDSDNNLILDPKIAKRDYGDTLNYKDFCGYLCVPRSGQHKSMAHKGEIIDEKEKNKKYRKILNSHNMGTTKNTNMKTQRTQENKLKLLGKEILSTIS